MSKLINLTCFIIVAVAAISQFGVLPGLGVFAAVYLLTPVVR